GLIDDQQLELALSEQKRTGELLGQILFDLGFISEDALVEALSGEGGRSEIDLNEVEINEDVLKLVNAEYCKENSILPLSKDDFTLRVAMVNAYDVQVIDGLERRTGMQIHPVAVTDQDLEKAIDKFYGSDEDVEDIIDEGMRMAEETMKRRGESGLGEIEEAAAQAPIIKLVDRIIVQAVHERCTDIHFEPDEKLMRVRFRIDGILHQRKTVPLDLREPIISRIKIMADLNIAERRIPQDGKIEFAVSRRKIDIRVSIFPTVNGENAVLRLLDRASLQLDLTKLGFPAKERDEFAAMLDMPYGIILVTGPTGSGKTTTLYSAIAHVNTLERKVCTLEDPVEYQLPIIQQSEINNKAGFTFALGLRSLLRQDPDVILVGEIRDGETAELAVRAALTGHLVLSTLHTNDAAGALPRLMDMGIEPFLVSSSILGIMAQRLVRLICPNCRIAYEPTEQDMKILSLHKETMEGTLGLEGLEAVVQDKEAIQRKDQVMTLYRGKGCNYCNQTGYKGRVAIFELIVMNKKLQQMAENNATIDDIRRAARKFGMLSMFSDGMSKVMEGITTIDEVRRVTLLSAEVEF
ncbi:MAG: Flp pilus assembly complex ATPase component TadA, partial [Candidatus Coatesbacteria bacterium]|nr:Flp pilus assembly complex ATPase component TadA [Candidatus Coatesbacteria bacterium]